MTRSSRTRTVSGPYFARIGRYEKTGLEPAGGSFACQYLQLLLNLLHHRRGNLILSLLVRSQLKALAQALVRSQLSREAKHETSLGIN
jgi:hypothetical protein